MKTFFSILVLAAFFVGGTRLAAAEKIPAVPEHYFNDYASVVSSGTASALNELLANNERETSNQLLVAIYPRMESDSSVEDYTVRVAQSWKVGQAGRNNGAVLFLFMQEREVYIQVGYGLEAVLPDATAKRIVENEIVPNFRRGNVDGGLTAAVEAMIAATKGEYQGTGYTANDTRERGLLGNLWSNLWPFLLVAFGLLVFAGIIGALAGDEDEIYYDKRGRKRRRKRRSTWSSSSGGSSWSSSSSSGSSWSSSSSSSSSGSFSSGGGSFGGGGAGGRW